MRAVELVAAVVLSACVERLPAPGPGAPIEPATSAPATTSEVTESPPPVCDEDTDCGLGARGCPPFVGAPTDALPLRPGYAPATPCRPVAQVPVAPACVEGRCVLVALDAPELRTCEADDACVLVPRGCDTTPIRADAREAFADVVGDAACAGEIVEAPAVCRLGVCVDPAWLRE
jgi:hypothetical protein